MGGWSDFTQMAWALTWIALCTVAVTLRTFGFWRWLASLPWVQRGWDRLLSWVARIT